VSRPLLGGSLTAMSRSSVLLAALRTEYTTTSDLYDRVGYVALARIGLIPYRAFRAELDRLSAAGLAETTTDDDGSTLWRLAADGARPGPAPDI
jgi:hypothetical protein